MRYQPADSSEERTVGPGWPDSIEAGKLASIIGLFLVIVFMVVAYGLFGIFANFACFNIVIILGALSALQATLTLRSQPNYAYYRHGSRCECLFLNVSGKRFYWSPPISAIDAGYKRALTTIIDSNLTTLFAAICLYSFGSGPIKGFAVTLAIGILRQCLHR